jgi:PAS domain S-box-containing protein
LEYREDTAATGNQILTLARSMAQLVDAVLQARISALETLATSSALEADDIDRFRVRAAAVANTFPGANILVLREDGQNVMNLRVKPGDPLPKRPNLESIQRVFATGQPVVSNLFESAAIHQPIVAIDVPVKRVDGRIAYVLSMNPPLDMFAEVIRRQYLPQTWIESVLDGRGVNIARFPRADEFVGRQASPTFLASLLAKREGILESTSLEGIRLLSAFSHGNFGWAVGIGVSRESLIGPVASQARNTLAVGVALLAISLVLAIYAAQGIARPIALLRRLAAVMEHDELPDLVPSGLREVDKAAQAMRAAEGERRRSRLALRKSDERFRLVVEAVPNAIIAVDADGIIELVNAQAEKMFGHPRADLLDQSIEVLLPERYRSRHPELRNAFFSAPQARLMGVGRELYALRQDGQEFPVEVGLSPIESDDGTKVLALIVDITTRRKAERMQAYYAAIVESTADAIIAKDLDGVVTSWNKAAELMFGYSAIEMIGKPIIRLLPADRSDEETTILAQIRRGEPIDHYETLRLHMDGTEFPVSLTISPIIGASGEIVGASKIVRDITARKRMEQNLQMSEDRFRSIYSAVSDGIFVSSPTTGQFIEVNEPGCTMFSYTADELIGRKIEMLSSGEPPYTQRDVGEWIEKARSSSRPQVFKWHCKVKDGRLFWAEISIRMASISGEDVVLATVRDVTERMAVEAQLRQAQKMEAIGNLTGGMAHDFNNLLGIIVGNLDLARDRLGSDEELHEIVGEALEAAWRGAELTRSLLAFSRRQPLRPTQIDPNELVANTVRLLGRLLGEDIEISLNLAEDIWPVVADPAQLEASLANLATNARDAMPRGGRLIVTTANRHLDADYAATHGDVIPGDFTMVEVSDTGVGMSAETASQIFEPFFTTKELGKGTGLGLSMVFGFLRQSGGHVNVYSEPGVGTTFRLYLPRAVTEALPDVVSDTRSVVAGTGETILVVEDNPAMRRVVLRQLRELGYRVLECDRAAAGLELLQREPVDLLLTDIVMPGGLDGVELARLALERWPALKVVLTSGFPEARINGNGEFLGSLQLLSKPYSKEELAAALQAALNGRATLQR